MIASELASDSIRLSTTSWRFTLTIFEVSSPGLDRPLKTHADFVRYAGEWAEVRLYRAQDGQKQFEGVLSSGAEEEVVLCTEDDQELRFALDDVALVKRLVRF